MMKRLLAHALTLGFPGALAFPVALQCTGCSGATSSDDAVLQGDASVADVRVEKSANRRREVCNGADDDSDGKTDEGCPIRLTTDTRHDTYPSLSAARVAWMRDDGVWVRDLPDGQERLLIPKGEYPAVSGDLVAAIGPDKDYLVANVTKGEIRRVVPPDADFLQAPALSGSILAWSQNQAGTDEDYEVYYHNLDTGTTTRVTTDPAIQEFPVVEGLSIVWHDDRFGHHTVGLSHLYDLFAADTKASASARAITHREGDLRIGNAKALNEGRVLAQEATSDMDHPYDPGQCRVVLYRVASGDVLPLTDMAYPCFTPHDLFGNLAVLEYDPDGSSDLFVVNVDTRTQIQLTNFPRRSTLAALSAQWIVWQDDRHDQWDIYGVDLTDMADGDLSPEGITP